MNPLLIPTAVTDRQSRQRLECVCLTAAFAPAMSGEGDGTDSPPKAVLKHTHSKRWREVLTPTSQPATL